MPFPVDEIFTEVGIGGRIRPPAYGLRKGSEGIVFHTTEGADASRAAAYSTARFQRDTMFSSYHFIVYDGGLLLTVPYLESAGSLATGGEFWAPGRYPWLQQLFSPAAYADPNAYLLAISLSGRTGVFKANGYPPNMVDTCARLVIWFEQSAWGADNAVLCNHLNWQTDRSDPGLGLIDLVLQRYNEILNPSPPVPIPTPTPIPVPIPTPVPVPVPTPIPDPIPDPTPIPVPVPIPVDNYLSGVEAGRTNERLRWMNWKNTHPMSPQSANVRSWITWLRKFPK